MQEIPLAAHPARTFRVLLDDQECVISLFQRGERLYMDLEADGVRICSGAVCLDGVGVVRAAQASFTGGLYFVDTQGRENPQWAGLGGRWALVYQSRGERL